MMSQFQTRSSKRQRAWALLALVFLWPMHGPAAAQHTDLDRLRQEALDLTNAARRNEGLSELEASDVLNEAAQAHADDMLERDFYAHVTPEGETPADRFRAAGGDRWALSAENIATCDGCTAPPDRERVRAFHEGWMQSPDHRANILGEGFDRFGFGIAGEGERVYAVQTFAGPGTAQSGEGTSQEIGEDAARDRALQQVNEARDAMNLEPLDKSEALDIVADRILSDLAGPGNDGGQLPKDIFALLPENSGGWTSLEVRAASLGGAGISLTASDIDGFIDEWRSADRAGASLGGEEASHLGFASRADGNGRKTAVAVFGERE